jgi:ribosomal protein L21E
MKKFKEDSRPDGSMVTHVRGPTGNLKFGSRLVKATVPTSWNTWSNGYTGSVYYESGQSLTLILLVGTKAFYFYVEPADGTGSFSAAAGQVSSHPRSINSDAGAKYFGFYGRRAIVSVKLITVTETGSTGGFAIGEFGIHCARPRRMCSRSNRHKSPRHEGQIPLSRSNASAIVGGRI